MLCFACLCLLSSLMIYMHRDLVFAIARLGVMHGIADDGACAYKVYRASYMHAFP